MFVPSWGNLKQQYNNCYFYIHNPDLGANGQETSITEIFVTSWQNDLLVEFWGLFYRNTFFKAAEKAGLKSSLIDERQMQIWQKHSSFSTILLPRIFHKGDLNIAVQRSIKIYQVLH